MVLLNMSQIVISLSHFGHKCPKSVKTFKRLQNKKWIIKGNFEEGINENYIVIKSLKTTKTFLLCTYSISQNGQIVQCLYNLFYELLSIISITYITI